MSTLNMLHKASHVTSYREVISLDNALTKTTLETTGGDCAVVSHYLVKDRFVHFSTNNVNINENTLDGKGTCHATQMATWRRGPPEGDLLIEIDISKTEASHIREAMTDIIPALNR